MAKNKQGATLKLDGRPLALVSLPPAVQKVRAFLDKQGDEDLFSRAQLAKNAGLSMEYVQDLSRREDLADYCHMIGHQKVWGSTGAIAELRRQMERPA